VTHPQADLATSILSIDHVGVRAADREAMTGFLCTHLGMQRTDHTAVLSVLRPAGGRAKLVVWDAGGATDAGVLERVVLRVSDMGRALSLLPDGVEVEHVLPELAVFEGPEGLGLGLTPVFGGGVDYDLDGLVLRVTDPDETMLAFAALGFVPRGGALNVADRHLRLEPGPGAAGETQLLSHIGLLVESVAAVEAAAQRAGLEIVEPHPPNQLALRVGPERITVEYSDRVWAP
jgi:catechol 2,3-dioxygenase-like lactoylglutathione lyase family enzyme